MSNGDILQTLFTNTWGLVLVVIFFCGSIFVHELGHYLAAKWRGLKIESFSIGFGPRLFGWRKNGIDYKVSLLPFGGYVKLPQLGDLNAIEGENETTDSLPKISYADNMYVLVAGAFFNVIFALFLALIIWQVGRPSSEQEQTNTVGYVKKELQLDEVTKVEGPAYLAGLKPGDKIVSIDGNKVEGFQDIQQRIATGSGRNIMDDPLVTIEIERGGKIIKKDIFPQLEEKNSKSGDRIRSIGVEAAYTVKVGNVYPKSPADKAGLQTGDIIEKLNGKKIHNLAPIKQKLASEPNTPVTLTIKREDELLEIPFKAASVPYTKPLGKITSQSEALPGYFKLLPQYRSAPEENPTALDKEADLYVFETKKGSPLASKIRVGNLLKKINGQEVTSLAQVEAIMSSAESVSLEFQKNLGSETIDLSASTTAYKTLVPQVTQMIGFGLERTEVIIYPNPVKQFKDKINTTFMILGSLLSRDSDISINHLNGPVGIGRALHAFSLVDIRLVLMFTVLLNINLAILNLLPIPVLDGGHMFFATIEKLRGKALPLNLIAATQGTFMFMLLGLMLYIVFYDSLRWMGDNERKAEMELMKHYSIPITFPES